MNRDEQVNQAFILWLCEHNARRPDPADILTLEAVTPGGVALTSEEVERSTEYLKAVKLIDGQGAWGRPMPLRARLTDQGLRCVLEHGGDVAAWLRSQQQYVDQSVNVQSGRDSQVAAYSQNVNQAQNASAVDVQALADAAQAVRELLPSLNETYGVDPAEVTGVIDEIETEVQRSEPDHGNLRRLGTRLKDLLGPAAATLTLAQFSIGAITAALG